MSFLFTISKVEFSYYYKIKNKKTAGTVKHISYIFPVLEVLKFIPKLS
jgi:hypothetical protein